MSNFIRVFDVINPNNKLFKIISFMSSFSTHYTCNSFCCQLNLNAIIGPGLLAEFGLTGKFIAENLSHLNTDKCMKRVSCRLQINIFGVALNLFDSLYYLNFRPK